MKKNELFIGALVNIYNFPNDNPKEKDLFPAQVTSVSTFDPQEEPDDVVVEAIILKSGNSCSRPLDTCLPIPITGKRLKKHGFTEVEMCDTFELSNEYCDIEIWEYSDTIWVVKYNDCEFAGTPDEQVTVSYWHELQYQLNKWGVELCE